jgi:hypothetical protein
LGTRESHAERKDSRLWNPFAPQAKSNVAGRGYDTGVVFFVEWRGLRHWRSTKDPIFASKFTLFFLASILLTPSQTIWQERQNEISVYRFRYRYGHARRVWHESRDRNQLFE